MAARKHLFEHLEVGQSVLVPIEDYDKGRACTDNLRSRWGLKYSWIMVNHKNYRCYRVRSMAEAPGRNPLAAKFKGMQVGDTFTISDEDYAKAQPLGAYYSAKLGIKLSWCRWPSGRHECTRLK